MPTIDLTFQNDINVSVQFNLYATAIDPKGADIIYYVPTSAVGVHDTATIDPITGSAAILELGPVTAINGNIITVNYPASTIYPPATTLSPTILPANGDFIMFAKRRSVNMSSLLGYFAKFRITNDSKDKAEMYSIAVDMTESSK